MLTTIKKLAATSQQFPTNGIYTFLNPYSYLQARETEETYKHFDGIYFDGILLCKLMHLIGIKSRRTSFDMTSLACSAFNWASNESKTVYFIGSTEESIKSFLTIVSSNFPKMRIAGSRNGYFLSIEEIDYSIQEINKINPSMVIVGMGAPLQEEYLVKLKYSGWRGVGFTCGGFIHQTAKKGVNYYPAILNSLNLRAIYRIYDEPKLIHRYLILYPKFFLFFIYDLFLYKIYSFTHKDDS